MFLWVTLLVTRLLCEGESPMTVTCYMLWDLVMWFVTSEADAGDSGRWHYSPPSIATLIYDHLHLTSGCLCSCSPLITCSCLSHSSLSISWSLSPCSLTQYPGHTAPLLFFTLARLSRLPGPLWSARLTRGQGETHSLHNQTLRPSLGLERLGDIPWW